LLLLLLLLLLPPPLPPTGESSNSCLGNRHEQQSPMLAIRLMYGGIVLWSNFQTNALQK
jgi:hypothetical protein